MVVRRSLCLRPGRRWLWFHAKVCWELLSWHCCSVLPAMRLCRSLFHQWPTGISSTGDGDGDSGDGHV